jgi:ABC-2 type transport system permease protein
MLRLWALIRNEFQREFAYPLSFVFFLVLPLLFTAAVGTGLGGMMSGEEAPSEYQTTIYVRSADDGALVEPFLDALRAVNLTPERVAALPESDFGLEIPADFSEDLLAGETVTVTFQTQPTNSTSQAVKQYVRAAQGRLGGAALVAQMGLEQARASDLITDAAAARDFFKEILMETLAASEDPLATAEVRWATPNVAAQQNDFVTNVEQASAGQVVTWVQITLLGAAEVLINERLAGTLKRMLVAPASRRLILGGKLLARFTLGLLQMAILFLGGAWLFGVNWGNDPLAVALVSAAFGAATVGLGMLLATFVQTQSQASSLVVGLSMGMAALGGAWWPLEITPPLYRQVVHVLPSTWAMQAYSDLLARGALLADVLPHIAVLVGFAVLFVGLGLWRFQSYE